LIYPESKLDSTRKYFSKLDLSRKSIGLANIAFYLYLIHLECIQLDLIHLESILDSSRMDLTRLDLSRKQA
jgi:hypothetical protein